MTIPRHFWLFEPWLLLAAFGVALYVLRTAGMVVGALWRAAKGRD